MHIYYTCNKYVYNCMYIEIIFVKLNIKLYLINNYKCNIMKNYRLLNFWGLTLIEKEYVM